mgnify:FL=1
MTSHQVYHTVRVIILGNIIVFNNGRVMHARESFEVTEERDLEGVYADWDYLLSAWRMAKVKLAQEAKNRS